MAEATDNVTLWKLVEKTDPESVKPITGKPYKGNSPKPHWLFYRATEVFGPCGIGWGVEIVRERIEDGGKAGDKVHIAHVRVWYEWNGKRGAVEHVGQTMFSGTNKNGLYTDEDAPKKSVTDATVKALSMIGFAGDIFSGRWDDSKYVSELREEFADQRRNEDQPSLGVYVEASMKRIAAIGERQALIDWWNDQKAMREGLGLVGGDAAYEKLFAAYKARGTAINVSNATAYTPKNNTKAA